MERDAVTVHCEDLIAVLAFRFGLVPAPLQQYIRGLEDSPVLEHLLEAAERAPTWSDFLDVVKRDGTGH